MALALLKPGVRLRMQTTIDGDGGAGAAPRLAGLARSGCCSRASRNPCARPPAAGRTGRATASLRPGVELAQCIRVLFALEEIYVCCDL
jgi:hypothetical protein